MLIYNFLFTRKLNGSLLLGSAVIILFHYLFLPALLLSCQKNLIVDNYYFLYFSLFQTNHCVTVFFFNSREPQQMWQLDITLLKMKNGNAFISFPAFYQHPNHDCWMETIFYAYEKTQSVFENIRFKVFPTTNQLVQCTVGDKHFTKNPAYRRQSISRPMQILAPMP